MKQPAAGRCPPGTNRRRGNAQVLSVESKVSLGGHRMETDRRGPHYLFLDPIFLIEKRELSNAREGIK